MNYTDIYNKLISRAMNRPIGGYIENHHILPKCMGGSNDASNIVALTAREHFVAHQLLVKMYPHNRGLIAAVNFLRTPKNAQNKERINNRMYEWLRIRHADAMSKINTGKKMTPEQIRKAALSHVGKKRTEESRARMRIAASKRKMSEAGKMALSAARLARNAALREAGIPHYNTGQKRSPESKAANSARFKGKKQTPDHIAKRMASKKCTNTLRQTVDKSAASRMFTIKLNGMETQP